MRTHIFEIEPMGAPRMNRSDAWRGREVVGRYVAYRDTLRLLANLQRFTLPDRFSVTFYLPMPASWTGAKKRRMDGQPHQTKPDWDNCCKAFVDSLRGDDAGIWTVDGVYKRWAYRGRIEVTVAMQTAVA